MRKNQFRKLFIIFTSLTFLDFFLSYIGIAVLGFIQEGNAFFVWLFEYSFLQALLFRMGIISLTVFVPILLMKRNDEALACKITRLGISLNVIVLVLHLRWVVMYILPVIHFG